MALALRRPVISLAPQTKAQQQQSQEKLRKLHQQLGVHKNQRRSSTVDSKMTKFKYTISVDETIKQTSKHKARFMALQ
jgi:polyisoprenoid-binding protein YceI